MYSVFVKAAGGRVVPVPPGPGFAFQHEEVCDAISDRTRIVFLTNPNNPTGQLIPRDAIREIVRRAPASVTIVIDEAYYDFCGETFLAELGAHSNVVIGRTFAKAHGLAGLRAGCLIGDPGRLEPVRDVVPPYSLSVFAVAGWRAALRDRDHLDWYRTQVSESRELLYAACDRLGLPYWKSAGNFVLINVGRAGEPADIVRAFAARGILIRDRSRRSRLCRVHPHHGRRRSPHRNRRRSAGGPVRRAVIDRKTRETHIRVRIGIEGKGRYDVRTGIRFLDHMLELVTRHGAFDLEVRATATSTSTSITPSRISASRSVRRSRRRWVPAAASTVRATSSCRWTRRWASRPSISADVRMPSSISR